MISRRGVVLTACSLVVALAMGQALRNGFVYDDLPAITQNQRVTDPTLWSSIPTSPYWLGTLWRPLTVAGFAVQWWLGGGAPWVFHAVALAGYLGCGLLLFGLLRRLDIEPVAALGAALLFLAHPVHVEVVANSVGQAEIWTALALLAATAIYVRARTRGVTGGSVAALIVMVAVAILTKEQGFMAPLLLIGAEWLLVPEERQPGASRMRLLVPVIVLSLTLLVLRAGVLTSFTGEAPAAALVGLGAGGRIATFLAVIPEYARLLIWPLHLQAEYSPPGLPVGGPIGLRHVIGAALLLGYLVLFALAWRRNRPAAFGLWWGAMTLAPVTNLLTPTGVIMAERLLFLPSIGMAIALGAVLNDIRISSEATRRWLHWPVVAAILTAWGLILVARSATRVPTWSTQRRFFTDLTQDAPLAYRAWKVSGEYWNGAADRPRGIAELQYALALWPYDHAVHERLGQVLRANGQCAAAIPVMAAGLKLAPDDPALRARLIECLIAERQWDAADRYAAEAQALGLTEFRSVGARVARLRAATLADPDRH